MVYRSVCLLMMAVRQSNHTTLSNFLFCPIRTFSQFRSFPFVQGIKTLDLKYFIVSTLVWIHTTKNESVCQLSQEQTLNLGPDRSSFKGPCYLTYKGLILVPQLA